MEMKSFPVTFTLLVGALLAHQIAAAPIQRGDVIFRPVVAEKGMVVGAEALAAEAALDVLQRGGNAVDAAVTMGFTIAVTLPRAGNIGGGGFMLVRMAGTGETVALDYRETAPAAAYRDMFLDEEGNPDPVLSRDSPLASGVPGTVAGLLAAHERFGSLPLEELMAPAIKLAREGFLVTPGMAESLEKAGADGRLKAEAKEVFFKEDNQPYQTGDRLLQPDLADSLERIATSGRAGFYTGPTAEAIVATSKHGAA
jgi:gamma-glutamyltranspeptidase/glutathione hydrolase